MTVDTSETQGQGAVIGGWICLALGAAFMFWSRITFILYMPLFFAAFVLGIVAIAQNRIWHGIPTLLLSVIVPLVIGFGLANHQTQQALELFKKSFNVSTSHSVPIEGVQIGMTTREIINLFSISDAWLNGFDFEGNSKKPADSLLLKGWEIESLFQGKINNMSITFKNNKKVSDIEVQYDFPLYCDQPCDNKNIDDFQHFISQRYGLSGNWSSEEGNEDWYRELIIDDYKYGLVLHNREGRGSGGPSLRVERSK